MRRNRTRRKDKDVFVVMVVVVAAAAAVVVVTAISRAVVETDISGTTTTTTTIPKLGKQIAFTLTLAKLGILSPSSTGKICSRRFSLGASPPSTTQFLQSVMKEGRHLAVEK